MVDEKTIDVDDEDEYYNTETKNRLDIISRNIIDKYKKSNTGNILFDKNIKLVSHIFGKMKYKPVECAEELYQVGICALWKSTQIYNPKTNVKFGTYAYKAIYNDMINFLTSERGRKNSNKRKYIKTQISIYSSLNDENDNRRIIDIIEDSSITIENKYITNESLSYIQCLNERSKKILLMTSLGYIQKDIGDYIGICQSNVKRIIRMSRDELNIMMTIPTYTRDNMINYLNQNKIVYNHNNTPVRNIVIDIVNKFKIDKNVVKIYVKNWGFDNLDYYYNK